MSNYTCRTKTLTPQPFVSMRTAAAADSVGAVLDQLFSKVWAYLNSQEHVRVGPAIVRYHAASDGTLELEAGFPVEQPPPPAGDIRCTTLPAGYAATTLHHGAYAGLPAAWATLQTWVQSQGLRTARVRWEIYWIDPSQAVSEAELRTELVWPLKEPPE